MGKQRLGHALHSWQTTLSQLGKSDATRQISSLLNSFTEQFGTDLCIYCAYPSADACTLSAYRHGQIVVTTVALNTLKLRMCAHISGSGNSQSGRFAYLLLAQIASTHPTGSCGRTTPTPRS